MKIICSLFLILVFSARIYSQQWNDRNAETNFYTIQKEFNAFCKDKDLSKMKGWKQFKRWEYFMEPRVYPSGKINNYATWDFINSKAAKYKFGIANWEYIGPYSLPVNMYNVSSNIGGAGRLNCMTLHPNDSNIIFVGAPSGGMWKSIDGGQSWSTATDMLASIGVSEIIINPSNPDIMYIATGDNDSEDTYSVGVLKSIDGGLSWNTTGLSMFVTSTKTVNRLVMHPENYDTLFAACSDGVYRSLNAGSTWSLVKSGINYKDIEFKPFNSNIIYISSYFRVYKSINSGSSFTELTSLSLPAGSSQIAIAVTPADSNYLYVITGNYPEGGFNALARSTDEGNSFTIMSTSPNILGWLADGSSTGGQASYDLALAASPSKKNEIIAGGINNWKSIDGGSTWSLISHGSDTSVGYVHVDIHGLYFSPFDSTKLFCCCDGGLFSSNDEGINWKNLSNGLEIAQIYRIASCETYPHLVMTGWQDNGINLYHHNNWSKIRGGDGMECIIDYSDTNYLYCSAFAGYKFRSSDAGQNWIPISHNLYLSEGGAWVAPYVMDPDDSKVLYCGHKNVYKSINRGTDWTKLSNFQHTYALQSLVVSPSNKQYIYTATHNQIYVTKNSGNSWQEISFGLPQNSITAINIHPLDPEIIWITMSGYSQNQKVYVSKNGGLAWSNYSGTLPNLPVNCITYENGSADGLYVGTDVGVYYRDTLLGDWIPFFDNLPNVVVNELEINYSLKKLRAATYGRGLWQSGLYSEYATVKNIDNSYYDIKIMPNPNPGYSKIAVNNVQCKEISIHVYNIE